MNINTGREFYIDAEDYEDAFIKILAEGRQENPFVREKLREILVKSNPRRNELIESFKWYHVTNKHRKEMMI